MPRRSRQLRGCDPSPDFSNDLLNDSKQLTAKQREALRPVIEREAVAWAVVMVEPEEIDRINILNASIVGMQRALDALGILPQHVIVDGNRFKPWRDVPYDTVVKGDATYMSIAAASVLAKTHRDELMASLAAECPATGGSATWAIPQRSILRLSSRSESPTITAKATPPASPAYSDWLRSVWPFHCVLLPRLFSPWGEAVPFKRACPFAVPARDLHWLSYKKLAQ